MNNIYCLLIKLQRVTILSDRYTKTKTVRLDKYFFFNKLYKSKKNLKLYDNF